MNNVFKKLGINNVLTLIDEMTLYREKFQDANLEAGPYHIDAFILLKTLLIRTVGTDEFRKILSETLIYIIPQIELALKTLLLIHLKSLRPCLITETLIIPDKFIKEGIFITKDEIDLLNLLSKNPINNLKQPFDNSHFQDKHYYFGNDDFNLISEVKESPDLNAFIWYVLNVSKDREAWYGTNIFSNIKINKNTIIRNLPNKESLPIDKDGNVIDKITFNNLRYDDTFIEEKKPYFNSIFTLIQTKGDRIDIEGNKIYGSLSPNSAKGLHFYFGNALEEYYFKREAHNNTLNKIKQNINNYKILLSDDKLKLDKFEEEKTLILSKLIIDNSVTNAIEVTSGEKVSLKENYENKLSELDIKINNIKNTIKVYETKIEDLKLELKQIENNFAVVETYRSLEQNHYYRKPLVLFNYDYIMGTKFLDEDILATQVIDNILKLRCNISIGGNMSYREYILEEELYNIINSIIETDDAIVSDCFFDFSNEKYNDIINKTEDLLKKQNDLIVVDTLNEEIKQIFDSVNSINKTSNKIEKSEVINGILQDINHLDLEYSKRVNKKLDLKLDVYSDSFNDILKQFTFVIIRSMITPKLMLLSIVNKRINGEYTSVSLIEWIKSMKDLLIAMVRKVKDMICTHLLNQLVEKVKPMASDLTFNYATESLEYYKMALRKAIECINFLSYTEYLPFDMDRDVTADIYNNKVSKNNLC